MIWLGIFKIGSSLRCNFQGSFLNFCCHPTFILCSNFVSNRTCWPQVQKQTQNYPLFLHIMSKDSWLIPWEHFQCMYLVLLQLFLGKDMRDLMSLMDSTGLKHFYVKLQSIALEYLQTVNESFVSCVWTLNTLDTVGTSLCQGRGGRFWFIDCMFV